MGRRLFVLCWHNVEGSFCFPSPPGSGTRGLERQLRFLRRIGTVVPLDEALATLRAGDPLPPRAIALTFDDGYRDNLELAVPMLQQLGLPATFFLVPGLLSKTTRAWWEVSGWAFARATRSRLEWEGTTYDVADEPQRRAAYRTISERLKRRPRAARERGVEELVDRLAPEGAEPDLFLDWDGARELSRRFHVGSHTLHHSILSEEEPDEQRRDLLQSRYELEHELQAPTPLLAYPNGTVVDYDSHTVDGAEQAQYAAAVTTRFGWNTADTPKYELHRLVMYPERGASGLSAMVARASKDRAAERVRSRR